MVAALDELNYLRAMTYGVAAMPRRQKVGHNFFTDLASQQLNDIAHHHPEGQHQRQREENTLGKPEVVDIGRERVVGGGFPRSLYGAAEFP